MAPQGPKERKYMGWPPKKFQKNLQLTAIGKVIPHYSCFFIALFNNKKYGE
jgi:hypothetical protein